MDFTSFDGPLSDLEDVLRSCAKALDSSEEGQLADFQDMVNEECVVRMPSKVSVSDFSFDSPLADLEDVLKICIKEIDLSSFDDPLSHLEDVLRTCAKPAEGSFQELLSNLEEIPWTFGRRIGRLNVRRTFDISVMSCRRYSIELCASMSWVTAVCSEGGVLSPIRLALM